MKTELAFRRRKVFHTEIVQGEQLSEYLNGVTEEGVTVIAIVPYLTQDAYRVIGFVMETEEEEVEVLESDVDPLAELPLASDNQADGAKVN